MFSNKKDFLDSIKDVTIKDNERKLVSFESIMEMSPLLTKYNAMTHSMYLQLNKDMLTNEEIIFHQEVIARLLKNEKYMVEQALKIMKNKEEYNNGDVEVIYKPIEANNKDKEIEL